MRQQQHAHMHIAEKLSFILFGILGSLAGDGQPTSAIASIDIFHSMNQYFCIAILLDCDSKYVMSRTRAGPNPDNAGLEHCATTARQFRR